MLLNDLEMLIKRLDEKGFTMSNGQIHKKSQWLTNFSDDAILNLNYKRRSKMLINIKLVYYSGCAINSNK